LPTQRRRSLLACHLLFEATLYPHIPVLVSYNKHLHTIDDLSALSEKPPVEFSLGQKAIFFPKNVTFPFDNKGKNSIINGESSHFLVGNNDVVQQ
jgi:hypothetical protein